MKRRGTLEILTVVLCVLWFIAVVVFLTYSFLVMRDMAARHH
jgi:hypothetical protein